MITVFPRDNLGQLSQDWLSARFHFSFASYFNPERIQFGPLRVLNDDVFRPQGGFPTHPHKDMEIITYVRKGTLTHADALGNEGTVNEGNIQVMSAGTGIEHSEFNRHEHDLELFQIWILPDRGGYEPRWKDGTFDRSQRRNRFQVLASGRPQHATSDAVRFNQNAALFAADLDAGTDISHPLDTGRRAYLIPARGTVTVNGTLIPELAGVEVEGESIVSLIAESDAEIILLDLP